MGTGWKAFFVAVGAGAGGYVGFVIQEKLIKRERAAFERRICAEEQAMYEKGEINEHQSTASGTVGGDGVPASSSSLHDHAPARRMRGATRRIL